jgi:2-polyprenyl-6-methoxyphenol hydroxylase-like FAD-dependent oxidoreductase
MSDPILIVGAGPTGLTAALELSRLGIPVRLIDKNNGPATTSRAIGIQARTLELMAQRGLADEIVSLGNKATGGSVYGGGKRVFRLDFSHVESRFNYILFLSQTQTERILRDAAAKHGVIPEWSTQLVGVAQDALSHDPSPVRAVLSRADGRLEQVSTPWLISAEGAHSTIRATLDLAFDGKTFDQQYALGDLHADADLADTDFHIFSSEHGFMAMFPLGGDHFRLIASHPLSGPQNGNAPSLPELQEIYDQRASIPARFRNLAWSSWFRINSRMVRQLKVGRLFLGGDAAHIHSPAGGQGMNTGIQDMINLAWKLAFVMRGKAPMALLDSFEQDRLPVMRDVLAKTENLTGLIGAESHIARTLFNHVAPWLASTSLVQETGTNRMAQVSLDYRDSPLSSNHPHEGALRAGDRVPDVAVRQRRDGSWASARLQSLLDPSDFVLLLASDGVAPPHPTLGAELDRAGMPVPVIEVAAPTGEEGTAFRRELGVDNVFLVRPDGYVAVAAGTLSAGAALDRFVRDWLSAPQEFPQ